MGDWLKDRYRELIAQGAISILCVFMAFWIYGWRDSGNANDKEHKALQKEKASLDYVNKQNSIQDFKIELKADKSLVESMDAKLDIIISKLPN
jgi:hypothetical protein